MSLRTVAYEVFPFFTKPIALAPCKFLHARIIPYDMSQLRQEKDLSSVKITAMVQLILEAGLTDSADITHKIYHDIQVTCGDLLPTKREGAKGLILGMPSPPCVAERLVKCAVGDVVDCISKVKETKKE